MTSRTDVSVTLHCQPPCWFSSQGEQSPADLGKIFLRITQGMDERHTDQIDEAVFYQLSIVSFLILLVTNHVQNRWTWLLSGVIPAWSSWRGSMFVFREKVEDHVTYQVAGISRKELPLYREDILSSRFLQYGTRSFAKEERFLWKLTEGKPEVMSESMN